MSYIQVTNEEFLKTIFADTPEGAVPAVCAFKQWGKANWKASPVNGSGILPSVQPDSNSFFSIGTVRNEQPFRRRKDSFVALHCLMLDDIRPEDMPVQPTMLLETSEDNFQAVLNIEAITDYVLADKLYRALIKNGYITVDNGGCNVVRYARLPEGTNTKPKCGTGGFKHIVHEWNPKVIYSVDEIIEGFELNLDEISEKPDVTYDIEPKNDPYYQKLKELGMIKYATDDKKFEVSCPWKHEHSGGADDGAFYDSARNKFHCNHNHMELRKRYGDLHTFTYYLKRWMYEEHGIDTIEFDDEYCEASGVESLKNEKNSDSIIFTTPREIDYDKTFLHLPEPPRILIDGIIPFEVLGFVGAGGTNKTTLVLKMMIHIILRTPIFGREINEHGACLFVSAEDSIDIIRFRVYHICKAMNLSDIQKNHVAKNLYVEDVTGRIARFVEADKQSNLVFNDHPEQLIDAYKSKNIKMVMLDPAMFFSPGERFVNDAEAALMQVARNISKGLGGAAVGYIHHTGKAQARAGTVDQYASRGGSAFADNSRALLVITPHDEGDSKDFALPPEIDEVDIKEGRVSRLHVAKFSFGKREQNPFWIVRGGDDNPWAFQTYESPVLTALEKEQIANIKISADKNMLMQSVWDFVKAEYDKDVLLNKTSIVSAADIRIHGKKAGKDKIRPVVEALISSGCLQDADLPDDQKQGGRKTYLYPVKNPYTKLAK